MESKQVYEDDKNLIIQILDTDGLEYYSSKTVWNSNEVKKFIDQGYEAYIVVDKKDPNEKFLLLHPKFGKTLINDSNGKLRTFSTVLKNRPELRPLFSKIFGFVPFVTKLREYVDGKISKYELKEFDPIISDVRDNELVLRFDKYYDFLEKYVNLSNDDAYFLSSLNNNSLVFYEDWRAMDDFLNGLGLWFRLEGESAKKMQMIANYLIGPIDLNDDAETTILARKLEELFPRETNIMVSDYAEEQNRSQILDAERNVLDKVDDDLRRLGFSKNGDYDEIIVEIPYLIMWASRYRLNDHTLKQIIKKIFEENEIEGGNWMDDLYEFGNDSDFDKESLESNLNYQLDNILEKLEEEDDNARGFSMKEFVDFVKRISSKYKSKTWYDLPKDKSIKFRLNGFNREKGKIKIQVSDKFPGIKNLEFSEDNFNKFLYQPEFKFGDLHLNS